MWERVLTLQCCGRTEAAESWLYFSHNQANRLPFHSAVNTTASLLSLCIILHAIVVHKACKQATGIPECVIVLLPVLSRQISDVYCLPFRWTFPKQMFFHLKEKSFCINTQWNFTSAKCVPLKCQTLHRRCTGKQWNLVFPHQHTPVKANSFQECQVKWFSCPLLSLYSGFFLNCLLSIVYACTNSQGVTFY